MIRFTTTKQFKSNIKTTKSKHKSASQNSKRYVFKTATQPRHNHGELILLAQLPEPTTTKVNTKLTRTLHAHAESVKFKN